MLKQQISVVTMALFLGVSLSACLGGDVEVTTVAPVPDSSVADDSGGDDDDDVAGGEEDEGEGELEDSALLADWLPVASERVVVSECLSGDENSSMNMHMLFELNDDGSIAEIYFAQSAYSDPNCTTLSMGMGPIPLLESQSKEIVILSDESFDLQSIGGGDEATFFGEIQDGQLSVSFDQDGVLTFTESEFESPEDWFTYMEESGYGMP